MNFRFKQKCLEQGFYKLEITGNFQTFKAIFFSVCYIRGISILTLFRGPLLTQKTFFFFMCFLTPVINTHSFPQIWFSLFMILFLCEMILVMGIVASVFRTLIEWLALNRLWKYFDFFKCFPFGLLFSILRAISVFSYFIESLNHLLLMTFISFPFIHMQN